MFYCLERSCYISYWETYNIQKDFDHILYFKNDYACGCEWERIGCVMSLILLICSRLSTESAAKKAQCWTAIEKKECISKQEFIEFNMERQMKNAQGHQA